MAAHDDSIQERAKRVHHSLEGVSDPAAAQVAVGGPCPNCGERIEIVMHADSTSFTCGSCSTTYTIDA